MTRTRTASKHVVLTVTLWNRTETAFVLLPPPEGRAQQKSEDEVLTEMLNEFFRSDSRVLGTWIETTPSKSTCLGLGHSTSITNLSYFITPPQIVGHFIVTTTSNTIDDEEIWAAVGILVDPEGHPPPVIIRAVKNRPVRFEPIKEASNDEPAR